MSKINQHNYEAFYLDYLEGNLNTKDTAQLLQFLEKNPELKSELEEFKQIELQADPEIKFEKETLRQNINPHNVEDFIIASIENETNTDDALELTDYLNHSAEARALSERYKKTILAKQEFLFPHKDKLKKKSNVIYFIAPLISAAAVALIFVLVNIQKTEYPSLPVVSHQKETGNIDASKVELPMNEESVVAEVIEKEQDSPIDTEKDTSADITGEIQNIPELNSEVAEEIVAENYEPVELKKLYPKTLITIGNHGQQSLAATSMPIINKEFAEITEQPVPETSQKTKVNSKEIRRINLLTIAELGLKVFGQLNERNYAVEPNYTSSGRLKSVTVNTGHRKITASTI